MSQGTNRVPNVNAIADELAKQNPTWDREACYSKAFPKYVIEMRAFRANVTEQVKASPTILASLHAQQAVKEAQASTPPVDVFAVLSRERDRLVRDGYTLEAATVLATQVAQEALEVWRGKVARKATANMATIPLRSELRAKEKARAAAAAAAAKPPPATSRRFVPGGMTVFEAAAAATAGQLPVRTGPPRNVAHERLMGRVRELQASGAPELTDYTSAWLCARAQLAEEDAVAADAAATADGGGT